MAITESEHPKSAAIGHSAHNADYDQLLVTGSLGAAERRIFVRARMIMIGRL
jgi:hypothetical protein